MSRYYLALVEEGDSTFTGTFARQDLYMRSFQVSQIEADFCSLTMVIERPTEALLDPTSEQWAWLSREEGSELLPLFFGRIGGLPNDPQAAFVSIEFFAKPTNFEALKRALASTLRVAPFFDYAFVDPQMWDDPDTALEARTDVWNIDRVTHAVTVTSLIQGEDGTLDITADKIPGDGFSVSYRDAPLRKVRLEMRAMWTQEFKGATDITAALLAAFQAAGSPKGFVTSYTGAGLYNDWPEEGDNVGSVYEFGPQSIEVADGRAIKRKYKSVPVKYDRAPTSKDEIVATRPFKADFRRWAFVVSSIVNHDVSIDRTEDISFDVFADVQSVVNDEADEQSEVITLSSGNVGAAAGVGSAAEIPIGDVARDQYFPIARGLQSIEYGLSHARALLMRRARCVEIKLRVPFSVAIQASCRKSATVHHPDLPGGQATGKIVGYSFGVDGDTGVESGEIVLACLVGRDTTLSASVGTPTYVDEDYVDSAYQEYSGRTILSTEMEMTYAPPNAELVSPAVVGLTSVTVENGETAQAALLSGRFIDPDAASDALNAIATQVRLRMIPLDTSPRNTRYDDSDVMLSLPMGIDLGEAA